MPDTLISLFASVLKVPEGSLNDNSSPDTVKEWDSLSAMHLVAALESTFNVRLNTKEIMRMSTIGIARQVLLEKKVLP